MDTTTNILIIKTNKYKSKRVNKTTHISIRMFKKENYPILKLKIFNYSLFKERQN